MEIQIQKFLFWLTYIGLGAASLLFVHETLVDFIAGACYALEGQQDVLAESIFIFFPNNGGHPEQEEPALKHSQAARDALISLARSEISL